MLRRTYKQQVKFPQQVIILGDFNFRIGLDAKTICNNYVGNFTDRKEASESGLRLLSLFQELILRVMNAFFQKPDRKRLTWYHPRGKGAIIDLALMRNSTDLLITDIRASRKADMNSDHCLVTIILKLKLAKSITCRNTRRDSKTWGHTTHAITRSV